MRTDARGPTCCRNCPPRDAENLSGSAIFQVTDGRLEVIAGGYVVAMGTYGIDGEVVSLVFQRGPAVAPGHVYQLRWSVYRGRLVLSAAPGREPLLALTARPLTRAG